MTRYIDANYVLKTSLYSQHELYYVVGAEYMEQFRDYTILQNKAGDFCGAILLSAPHPPEADNVISIADARTLSQHLYDTGELTKIMAVIYLHYGLSGALDQDTKQLLDRYLEEGAGGLRYHYKCLQKLLQGIDKIEHSKPA